MSAQLWQLMALKQEKQRLSETARRQGLQLDLGRIRDRREYLESVIADCAAHFSTTALNGNHLSNHSGYMRQVLKMRHQLQLEEERINAELVRSDASLRVFANEERKFEKLEQLARQEQQRQEDKLLSKELDELNIALFNKGSRHD